MKNLSVRKFLWDEESLKVNNKLNLVRGDLKEFKKVFQRVERNAPSSATKLSIYTKYFKNLTYALANEIGFGVHSNGQSWLKP